MNKKMQIFQIFWLMSFAGCSTPKPVTVPQNPKETLSHLEMGFEDLAVVEYFAAEKSSGAKQTFKAFADERYSEEQEVYLKLPLKNKVKYWNPSCEQTCSCDFYVGFAEYLQAFNFNLSTTEKNAVEKLRAKSNLDKGAIASCMDKAPWVRQSRVLKDIIKRTSP
ncbi:hypothetical protein K2X05_05630 [bacterium]|nr:hypothetical protein [bacterium]